ncbi:MAG: hypothetical protein Q9M19_04855 [Mariprofundaceae bacterium]|nr:hypothetical protein [Mariprofundaceae bacterium]
MALPTPFVPEVHKTEQGPWIYLVEQHLDATTVVRVAQYPEDVVFDGQTYTAFAFRVEAIEQTAEGRISDTRLVFASPNGLFQDYIEQYNGLVGQNCLITIVNANLLNDPTARMDFQYVVFSSSFDSLTVTLDLATRLDETLIKVPIRRITRPRCMHTYKGEGCWIRSTTEPFTYSQPSGFVLSTPGDSSGNTCSKILNDTSNGCKAHANTERFGAFPGVTDHRVILNTVS